MLVNTQTNETYYKVSPINYFLICQKSKPPFFYHVSLRNHLVSFSHQSCHSNSKAHLYTITTVQMFAKCKLHLHWRAFKTVSLKMHRCISGEKTILFDPTHCKPLYMSLVVYKHPFWVVGRPLWPYEVLLQSSQACVQLVKTHNSHWTNTRLTPHDMSMP